MPGIVLLASLLVLAPLSRAVAADGVPALDHVVVVVMENHAYDEVRTMPYTAGLIAAGASFSDSHGVTHPSQPNYLALWSGSTQGVTNDQCPPPGQPYSGENLGHACETAGLTWKAYSENLPAVGSTACSANSSLYTRKHDPWTDFSNLDHTNEVPYAQLATDLAANSLPNLVFIVPNNCHNSHDSGCSVAAADIWLSQQVPALLDAMGPDGLLILTWDEDDFTQANHILTVFRGDRVQEGIVSPVPMTHYTVLRVICDVLGLTPFGAASAEPSLTGIWKGTVGIPEHLPSWGGVKSRFGG